MGLEIGLQGLLHAFEQGRAMVWLRRLVVAMIIGLLATMWFAYKFNGFSVPESMDQAQIGRQLATGQGFTTLYARPLALHLMLVRTGTLASPLPETSQAPLGPLLNAVVLWAGGESFAPGSDQPVVPAERAITAVTFLFFAGSLALSYLLGRWLFDGPLALIGLGLIIASDLIWRFTFSGLPQMAMLFLFTGALLALARALEANEARRRSKSVVMILTAALLLGLMTLGHGLGLWIFAGFWLYAVAVIRPRWLVALASPVVYVLPLLPWAWHNWRALRNPFGLSFYELYRQPQSDPLASPPTLSRSCVSKPVISSSIRQRRPWRRPATCSPTSAGAWWPPPFSSLSFSTSSNAGKPPNSAGPCSSCGWEPRPG